jgi:putative SOS response-associated peptidase YedK
LKSAGPLAGALWNFEQWENGTPEQAAALMKPAGERVLLMWPVSKRVNSSRAPDNDPTLIERVKLNG